MNPFPVNHLRPVVQVAVECRNADVVPVSKCRGTVSSKFVTLLEFRNLSIFQSTEDVDSQFAARSYSDRLREIDRDSPHAGIEVSDSIIECGGIEFDCLGYCPIIVSDCELVAVDGNPRVLRAFPFDKEEVCTHLIPRLNHP